MQLPLILGDGQTGIRPERKWFYKRLDGDNWRNQGSAA